uniref:Preproinsulin n=1 Tax=Nothobranchius kuhntae TaxID=321403 RepID=A0A1A8ISB4_NOTKU
MATLWTQTAALLVLLVMSCPSSRATSLQQLCGPHLTDALYLVCGERGFLFNPRSDDITAMRNAALVRGENEGVVQMGAVVKRGILELCCDRPCTIFDLQQYCF